MITPAQRDDLIKARQAALLAGHLFPGAAAAEAAAESAWFSSSSAVDHNNLLGIKRPSWWTGPVFEKTASEQHPDGSWYTIPDTVWCEFESWQECFECQMQILKRNPRYAEALAATTPELYISAESQVWSTGILRGRMVMQIYHAHLDVLLSNPLETA